MRDWHFKSATKGRTFYIVSEFNGKVLNVTWSNKAAGTPVIMFGRNSTVLPHQLWYLDHQGYIRSALTDFAIDAGAYCTIRMQPFNGGSTQQWRMQGRTIKNDSIGQVLDIKNENKDDRAEVMAYTARNGSNQNWRIEFMLRH